MSSTLTTQRPASAPASLQPSTSPAPVAPSQAPRRQPTWQRIILLIVLGFEVLGCLSGGALLVAAPDGHAGPGNGWVLPRLLRSRPTPHRTGDPQYGRFRHRLAPDTD